MKKQADLLQLQINVLTLQKSLAAAQQTPSAASTLKDQLQTEKDIADLKSAMATSQVARVKAELGAINTANLPKGDAALTGVDIQPTILGYGALKTAISRIDTSFCNSTIVLGSGPPESIVALKAYTALINELTKQLDKYQKPLDTNNMAETVEVSAQLLPTAIFAGIDAVVALGSLFKTDVTINGVAMTADEKTARFLMEALLQGKCKILDPQGFTGPVPEDGSFVKKVTELDDKLADAVAIATEIKTKAIPDYTQKLADAKARLTQYGALTLAIAEAEKQLDDPNTPARDKPKLRKLLKESTEARRGLDPNADKKMIREIGIFLSMANDRVAAVDDLNGKATKVLTALYKVDDAGTPFLTRMMEAEAMAETMKRARFLTMSVAKLGGNNIVKKNAFHTSIRYAGGVVVAYQVKDADGLTVVAAGQESAYCTRDGKDETLNEPCSAVKH